jgi:hypothetical protein
MISKKSLIYGCTKGHYFFNLGAIALGIDWLSDYHLDLVLTIERKIINL